MADTTSRANATNSGRAGISSSTVLVTGVSWLRGAHSVVDGVMDGEDLGEAGDLEHLQDAALGADQEEVAVVAAQALEPAHEHAQAGGVQELDALEVDDDPVLAFGDQLDESLAEPGTRVPVHFPAHAEDGVPVPFRDIETQIHRPSCVLAPR